MSEATPILGADTSLPSLRLVDTDPVITPRQITIEGAEGSYTHQKARDGADPVPLIVFGGFAGIESAYVPFRDAVASLGKDAVSANLPRRLPLRTELQARHLLHPHRLTSMGIRRTIEDVQETFGVEKVDVAVHSKGGRDIMWSAHHVPGIRSLVFMASVGVGEHSIQQLALRVPGFGVNELPFTIAGLDASTRNLRSAGELASHLFMRPHRTFGEMVLIHCAKIADRFDGIRELGTKVGVMEFAGDGLLPFSRTLPGIGEYVDDHTIFNSGESGHAAPVNQPIPVARAVLDMLDRMHAPTIVPGDVEQVSI